MRRWPVLLLLALGLPPFAATARDLAGEFVVSTSAGFKSYPAAAMDDRGEVLVAWQEGAVYGQRYDPEGARRGGNFFVGTNAENYRGPVSAAIDRKGFSVVWEEEGQFPGAFVFFRRFDVAGREVATRFLSKTVATVATDSRGVSVVPVLGRNGVLVERFDAAGRFVGSPFVVTRATAAAQVTADAAGDFVIVWATPQGVFGRRFNNAARPRGGTFQVSAKASSVAIAGNAAGSFAVTWTVGSRLFARLYRPDGTPAGEQVLVTPRVSLLSYTTVAMDATGRFLVAWVRLIPGVSEQVLGRFFEASGKAQGGEFPVSSENSSGYDPVAAAGPPGDFLVVWLRQEAPGQTNVVGRWLSPP